MERRVLGRTGLTVSAVGFGGGGIGQVWGQTTDEESVRAVRVALERGITFFDVAPGYGDGRAERVLGRGLSGAGDDIVVMTKVALDPDAIDDIPGYVMRSFAASLERLGRERVDLLIIHNMVTGARQRPYRNAITPDDALRMVDAMRALVRDGRVGHLGFTAWRCTQAGLDALLACEDIGVLQTEVNLLNPSALGPAPQGAGLGVMDQLERDHDDVSMEPYGARGTDQLQAVRRAEAAGIGVVAIRPLAMGLLTDVIDRPFDDDPAMGVMRRRAERFRFLLDDPRRPTLSGAALRYAIGQPGVHTVIPGIKNVAEVEDAVAASTLPGFTDAELARITRIAAGDEDEEDTA
jgi:aryl-alcohol dehydrogenase-like predicted oxidoreductase